ncbi:proline--tRNA ligase [Cohnella endophytica]|uniref:Proline--tRNA ligase n=1 Tax=Cohnella endophytica TaxID=2419778 RepID=A0A494Y5C0_9BACL|nr:proline--tRNA ligase [Cohnella endophytica]RKP55110.1 proline--tRNA ligase [Cohnella endophytica]
MRQSKLFAQTYREAPSDAEALSHRLLLRAGFIRPLAAGIYAYLPLGQRVLRNVERIVREEMDRTGAQELLMPAMQPLELWEQSGRDQAYGPELIRLKDRHEREFALGPTHEEVVTTLFRGEVNSYRKLPVTLYQIQTKFRDERRPRFGLLRGREFVMKDAYSFDEDWEGLDRSYQLMYEAYRRIFDRCGLNYRAVEADAGSIGGEGETHEFMALADIGEDTIVSCEACDYAANLEKAEAGPSNATTIQVQTPAYGENTTNQQPQRLHTPNVRTIDELVTAMQLSASRFVKTMIYIVDGQAVAVLVRGDREVNELKVKNALQAEKVEIADADTVLRVTGAPSGFAGPIGLSVPLLVDIEIANGEAWIAGAIEADYHVSDVRPGRDFTLTRVGDYRNVAEDDVCPRCRSGKLQFSRGIEVGHVFKLGTKYSERMNATLADRSGNEKAVIMGCYGIGVSRLLSAIAEQYHDGDGMAWPMALAPYQVHIVPVSVNDSVQMELAERLYGQLRDSGVDTLLDDREERPGVKFKDSDLMGIPIRIVIGKQAAEGVVEFKLRTRPDKETVNAGDVCDKVKEAIREALGAYRT